MLADRTKRIAMAALFGALLAVVPATAAAHSPTQGEREYTTSGGTGWFYLGDGTSALSWFITPIETSLESDWVFGNNTLVPHFQRTADEGVEIRYTTNANTPNTAECPDTVWYACTEYLGAAKTTWLSTTFNSENPPDARISYWCDHPSQPDDNNCRDLRRISLHEAGHGVGLARGSNGQSHQADSVSFSSSVMQTNGPGAPMNGWNYRILGTCDRFELAREYDVISYSTTYPQCVDHMAGVGYSGGKIVTVTGMSNPADACIGSSVPVSGYLRITNAAGASDDGQLGLLANNGIGGRTIDIYRRTASGAYGTTPYTTTTVADAAAGTWSRGVSSASSGTWYFRASFTPSTSGDAVVFNGDVSGQFSVTWSSPC